MTQYFFHPNAIVESSRIGPGTRIWAFVHVLPRADIGADCNICDHVFIENDVTVGDRVTIKCGVQLWDGVTIEDDVFIGPNATFTNDPFPRSRQHPPAYARTLIRKGASIGANATILPGLTIGQNAMVGAGAVVTKNVPPHAIVVGNPAQITGYVNAPKGIPEKPAGQPAKATRRELGVAGVQLHEMPLVTDLRGNLSFAEVGDSLPFPPRRYFLVYDVPNREIRGEHAHRTCHQLLLCVRGSCSVVVDDGAARADILLDQPNLALHIPPMIWAIEYKYSSDAVLLVLASEPYDANDYIREYDTFLGELKRA